MVRPYHPLEGRSLELIGCRRRGGELELTVVLADGSRRAMPAGWTDVWGAGVLRRAGTLGSIGDLLAARWVLDGVLRAAGLG